MFHSSLLWHRYVLGSLQLSLVGLVVYTRRFSVLRIRAVCCQMVLGSCNVGDCGKCISVLLYTLSQLGHWSLRPGCGDPFMLSKCRFWDL